MHALRSLIEKKEKKGRKPEKKGRKPPLLLEWHDIDIYDPRKHCSLETFEQYKGTCYVTAASLVMHRLLNTNKWLHRLKFPMEEKEIARLKELAKWCEMRLEPLDENTLSTNLHLRIAQRTLAGLEAEFSQRAKNVREFLNNVGRGDNEACLSPPPEVKAIYHQIYSEYIVNYRRLQANYNYKDFKNAPEITHTMPAEKGGFDDIFLTALLVYYGVNVGFEIGVRKFDLQKLRGENANKVYIFNDQTSLELDKTFQRLSEVCKLLKDVQAVLLTLKNENRRSDHVVAAFPCEDTFVICNSWGVDRTLTDYLFGRSPRPTCTTGTLGPALTLHYTHIRAASYICLRSR